MIRVRTGILILLLFFSQFTCSQPKPTIGVFVVSDTPFWAWVGRFAEAAGHSLGADVQVFNAQLNRVLFLKQFRAAAAGRERHYDALVFPNFLHTAPYALDICERNRVVCVLFNSDLSADEQTRVGRPGERLKYWVGHMVPDDIRASEAMTEVLVRVARNRLPEAPVHMIGVNGYRYDQPAIARELGLRKALAAETGIHLRQVVHTDWSEMDAYVRTRRLLKRYPDTGIVWSGNYRSTTGILRALREADLQPGRDVWVNSFGLEGNALEELAAGEVEVTAGGHFMEGAWALILAYDALAETDTTRSYHSQQTPLLMVTRDNLAEVRQAMGLISSDSERLSRVDFTVYSRAHGVERDDYDFSIMRVLQALAKSGPVGAGRQSGMLAE